MALGSYSELQTAVATWLNKTNLNAYIPDFIRLAEADIFRRLRVRKMEASATGNLTALGTLDLTNSSTRLAKIKSLAITVSGQYKPLNYIAPSAYFARYAAGNEGAPDHYTIIGTTIHFGPQPDSDYPFILWYLQKPEALSVSVTTNWILQDAPDAYLYGALIAATPFIKDDQRLVTWNVLYEQAIGGLEAESVLDFPGGTQHQLSEMGTP